jgi:hypothetical protein
MSLPNVRARTYGLRNWVHAATVLPGDATQENDMSVGTIILIILVLILVGAIPTWPHSKGWGYGPSGGLGLIVVILLILVLLGKI